MAIEELQHPGGLPDRGDPLVEAGDVDRVDDPDLRVEADDVAGALHHLAVVGKPGEPELVLLEERLAHQAVIAPVRGARDGARVLGHDAGLEGGLGRLVGLDPLGDLLDR